MVTVESNGNETDEDSLDLLATACVRHYEVSPEPRQHNGKLTAMTTMLVKNSIASDMVISPGTRIGDIDIVIARDTPIFQISRGEYRSDPRVQHRLKDYVSHSDTEQYKKAEEIRVGIDTFTPETDLPVGDWRRKLKYDIPSMLQEVWTYELRGDYCKFLEHHNEESKFGDTLTDE